MFYQFIITKNEAFVVDKKCFNIIEKKTNDFNSRLIFVFCFLKPWATLIKPLELIIDLLLCTARDKFSISVASRFTPEFKMND